MTHSAANARSKDLVAPFRGRRLAGMCLLLYFLVAIPAVRGQDYTLSRQIVFEKIGRQRANAFLEDRFGLLWIGADQLYRYDGHEVRPVPIRREDGTEIVTGRVNALLEDRSGAIWIGTGTYLYRYDRQTNRFREYTYPVAYASTSPGFGVLSLYEDPNGRIWFGTENRLYRIEDQVAGQVWAIPGIDLSINPQNNIGISHLHMDARGHLFAVSRDGLWQLDAEGTLHFHTPETWTEPAAVYEMNAADLAADGSLLIGTNRGLYRFQPQTAAFTQVPLPARVGQRFLAVLAVSAEENWAASVEGGLVHWDGATATAYAHDPGNPYSIYDNFIQALYKDRFENIWIGMATGINRANFHQRVVPFYQLQPGPYQRRNFLHRIMQDSSGTYWFRWLSLGLGAGEGPGRPGRIVLDPPWRTQIEEIKDFCTDRDGNVWVITLTHGLYRFAAGRFEPEAIDLGDSLSTAFPVSIRADPVDSRYLWFTSREGLCRVDRFALSCHWYRPLDDGLDLVNNSLSGIYPDSSGIIWLSARKSGGQVQLFTFDTRRERFAPLAGSERYGFTRSYQSQRVGDRELWTGTSHGVLIVDLRTHAHRLLSRANGLPLTAVQSLVTDHDGNVWLADEHTLCRFDGTRYECYDGRPDIEQFSYRCAIRSRDGRLIFGGTNGLYAFYPGQIRLPRDTVAPRVYLTGVNIFGRERILPRAPEQTEAIELPYRDNVLSLAFSAPHFWQADRLQYEYRLENFSTEWTAVTPRDRTATFTSLSPGRYVFRVRARNADGVYSRPADELRLALRIRPPWYRTGLAYGLYLALIATLLLGVRRFEIKRQEARHWKELNQLKSRLYTNITHEFRTPLTLVIGIARRCQQQVEQTVRRELQTLERNGQRLLDLVNQMLELARIEGEKGQVNFLQADCLPYLRYLVQAFESLAEEKEVELRWTSSVNELRMDFDPEKLRRIVGNLLSNAIKFTPSGGRVTVAVSQATDPPQLAIDVVDTGPGIPPAELPRIFDRFYQVDDSATRSNQGTGIGLTLCHELVTLLGGTLRVASEPGAGSRFTVALPISRRAAAGQPEPPAAIPTDPATAAEYPAEAGAVSSSLPTLLIVEDNADVVAYLRRLLEESYRITVAGNGEAGWQAARRQLPDLILSDVMMPVLDGFSLCRRLKIDRDTSHIPVVLLTAKVETEDRLTGLRYGADAYLNKPFDERELRLRLRKLLESRAALQAYYTSTRFLSRSAAAPSATGGEIDQEFFQRLVATVDQHLATPDLTAEALCRELHMSYSTGLRKVKALTGMTITQYIRHIRMHRAARRLREEPMTNIGSVAQGVGYLSANYFARDFRKVFRCSPSAFRAGEKGTLEESLP